MYWNKNMCHDDALVLGWIVTLDVLKCCMSGYKFYKLNRWIVTLDVLKYECK